MNQYEIGKFIAELRKEKGLTQEDLAEIIGVTDKSVSRWENGKTLPDISLLVELSEILEVSIEELLKGKRLNEEEFLKQNEIIENVIEYGSKQKSKDRKKIKTKLNCGILIVALATLNGYIPYINFIFTPNFSEHVQGFLYGIGIALELISVYDLSHEVSFCERKNILKEKLKK